MRCMARNMRPMWLSKPVRSEVVDEDGLGTGEYVNGWTKPSSVLINASAPTGDSSSSPFGTQVAYDLALVAGENTWGIEEGDRMWLGQTMPELDGLGQPSMRDSYEVKRVSQSLNYVSFALTRTDGR